MAGGWQLAQINVGRLLAAEDDPQVAGFFAELGRINALADASPGFVWRLQDGDGAGATGIHVAPDPLFIVNMSVWSDAEALSAFVYRSGHAPVMARRRQWFAGFDGAYQALWWIPAGHRPSVDEGLSRLWLLDRFGASDRAFTFKARFAAAGVGGPPTGIASDPRPAGAA